MAMITPRMKLAGWLLAAVATGILALAKLGFADIITGVRSESRFQKIEDRLDQHDRTLDTQERWNERTFNEVRSIHDDVKLLMWDRGLTPAPRK